MPGFDNNTMYADNVDFRGVQPVVPQITTDGQLLIGSTATPHIKAGTLTSLDSSITITPGSGTIDLSASSGGTKATFLAYRTTSTTNDTGDSTQVNVVFDTVQTNNGFTYNATTGVLTCITSGFYGFSYGLALNGFSNQTGVFIFFSGSAFSPNYQEQYTIAPYTGTQKLFNTIAIPFSTGDTMQIILNVQGGTKTVGINGSFSASALLTSFSAWQIA
jgi:hypothetical protein